jgi:hypothetical protein
MALFSNFSNTYRDTSYGSTTASSQMTADLKTELVTNGNWTEPSAGRFKSPVDADGRFLEIVTSEPTSVRWQWQVLNDLGGTVCTREVLLSGAGETVRFMTGDYYAWAAVENGVDEYIGAGLLDLTPEAQDAHTNYTWGRGYRNSSGTQDGQGDVVTEFFLADNGTYSSVRRLMSNRNQASTEVQLVTFAGNGLHVPATLAALNASSQLRVAGRLFNAVTTFTGAGNTFTMVIGDAGEKGTFFSIDMNPDSPIRLAVS